ncbi:MAG: hypothetical protein FWC72_01705 [Oscillospiraceae bacterium]|nr:hypothetical protein [Oscillospiraceae bacterium]
MTKELPQRKRLRLEGYDYSNAGYYFVTVCVKDRHELLGEVVGDAPLRVPHVALSEYGVFVDAQIRKISHIYPYVLIDHYIIMPNHIHVIANIEGGTRRGASPTKAVIPRIVQSLKSMTTKRFGFNMWQTSYHDHIIRDEAEYQHIWQYVDENPARWTEDCYYIK